MLSKRYESTEVDRRTWLHVPSGTHWSTSSDTHQVVEIQIETSTKRKRKRSDSILWQKPLHQQKCQKGKVTTQTTPQKSSIKQRLRTDLGRSVGVTTNATNALQTLRINRSRP